MWRWEEDGWLVQVIYEDDAVGHLEPWMVHLGALDGSSDDGWYRQIIRHIYIYIYVELICVVFCMCLICVVNVFVFFHVVL